MTSAYQCMSKWGPYECGAVDYYVSAGIRWLLFGMLVAGVVFYLVARVVAKVREPEDRRQRALDRRQQQLRLAGVCAAGSRSIRETRSRWPGSTSLPKLATRVPERSIRYLWKFHCGFWPVFAASSP